jgi:lysophospholipase L1-like esterase
MQNRKLVWYSLAAASLSGLFVLGTGAVLALQDSIRQPESRPSAFASNPATQLPQTPAKSTAVETPSLPAHTAVNEKNEYHIVALGDSLTRGMGDEKGQGYVGHLTRELQKTTTEKVSAANLGINGMQSPELLEYVNSPEVRNEIKAASLITLSIGGNDLTNGAGTIAAPDEGLAKQTRQAFLSNLDQILQLIRSQNRSAPILFVGLYNPFPYSGELREQALNLLEEWNLQTSRVLRKYPDTILIPTQDLFVRKGDVLLAPDHFHPNSKGYKAIAERMLQDLK